MMGESRAVLYSFFTSSCSWRVRAVMHWKRIPLEERPVDIVKEKDQLTEKYKSINPSQKVPALLIDGETLVESMAIIQYLEDTRPEPSLTPNAPLLRARVREICETIVSGIQPLQNIGLKPHFENEQQFQRFAKYYADRGLQTLETLLKKTAGQYCVGDQITLADICLVPQLYNSVTRLELDISKYPVITRLYNNLLKEKMFSETHPLKVKPKL